MTPKEFIKSILNEEERRMLWVDDYNEQQAQILHNVLIRQFSIGKHTDGYISEIKYEGRLVILDDGSRWEVDSFDCYTTDLWSSGDRVVVIDDEMYRLDDAEKVPVTEEFD